MLYNQSWNRNDIFSLDRFIAWIETQPRWKTYPYTSGQNCLIAQYLKSQGVSWVAVGRKTCTYELNGMISERDLPEGWNDIACAFFFFNTFGAALRRAKKLRLRQKREELAYAV